MKICIDPGHYGSDYNPGVAAGYVESNFTWKYAWLLKERLEKYKVEIVMTRATKEDYPKNSKGEDNLKARGRMASGCDLFISVHSNATDNKPDMDAIFVHWSIRSGGESIGKKIGNALTMFFRKEWGHIEDPCMYCKESEKYPGYDHYGVLKGASEVGVPGIIIEHSFHTCPHYCEWAMIDGNIERMADAEVAAIAEYYNLSEPIEDDFYHIELTTDLKKGDKGEGVKRLQMRMRQVNAEFDAEVKAHSFKNGIPDGSFGGKMVETMKKFQRYAGIPATGECDAETRMVLNECCATMFGDLQESNGMIAAVRNILG